MKANRLSKRKRLLFILTVMVAGWLIGAATFTMAVAANTSSKPQVATLPASTIPTPTAPTDSSIGMSISSGAPGAHLFMAATGYTPGEFVQPVWNYTGPGTGTVERSYFYYSPIRAADAGGTAQESLFIPVTHQGTYTLAMVGATSGVVKTNTFQVVPSIDSGIYIGNPGTALRLIGWGFAATEVVTFYWNWTASNNGQLIGTTPSDRFGHLLATTPFTVPAGTANGSYTVAAIGAKSGVLAQIQFTVGTPSLGGQPQSSDWSNYGFDLQGTHVNPTESTINASNVGTLALKWKNPGSIPYKVTGAPLIANGIVYVGDVLGIVTARSLATGNVLWTFYANAPFYSSPTIQNGIVYFGSVAYPFGGIVGNYVYALNAIDGSLIWKNYLPNGADWVTPLVSNGKVFVPTALKEGVSGGYSAFDALTGATIWSIKSGYGMWSPSTMNPAQTELFVTTGNACNPDAQMVCPGNLLDLDPNTGKINWQIQFPGLMGEDDDAAAAPLYSNGRIYTGLKSGIFYCLDATNGNIIWQYNTGMTDDAGIFASAALYNNMVYFGSGDNLMHALNISDGSLAWTFKTGSDIVAAPAIAGGVLYIGSKDKFMYALDTTTGAKLWSYKTLASIWSPAAVSNGVLYISGGDTYVYAFTLNGQ